MNADAVFGMIVMTLCCFGSGALFCGIGKYAARKPTPMGFWANGSEIKPEDISDITAYNLENGRMWKFYSIPYWLSGISGIGICWSDTFAVISVMILAVAGTIGIWWLIRSYQSILARYSNS